MDGRIHRSNQRAQDRSFVSIRALTRASWVGDSLRVPCTSESRRQHLALARIVKPRCGTMCATGRAVCPIAETQNPYLLWDLRRRAGLVVPGYFMVLAGFMRQRYTGNLPMMDERITQCH